MAAAEDKVVEILNGLLQTNTERIEVYSRAADDTTEVELKTVFQGIADESRKNITQLSRELSKHGMALDPHRSGTVQNVKSRSFLARMWADLKLAILGKDAQSLIRSCDSIEDAAQRKYKSAIASNDISNDTRQLIRNQQAALQTSHELMNNYRHRSQFVHNPNSDIKNYRLS